MTVSRKPRYQAGFVAGLTVMAAMASMLFNADPSAGQTTVVTGGRASAYGASDTNSISTPLPPTPAPIQVVTADCPLVRNASGVPVTGFPVNIGAVSARVECSTLGTPTSFFKAEADVGSARIESTQAVPVAGLPVPAQLPQLLDVGAVHTECVANAQGVSAVVSVVNVAAAGVPVPVGGPFTSQVTLPIAFGTITFREGPSDSQATTANTISVNGVHIIQMIPAGPPPLPPFPVNIDLILGHVDCARVLGQITTTTTLPDGSTTLPGGTTTTLPGGTTTTTRAGATTTTSTTVAGAVTTTTAAGGGTTTPAVVTVTTRPPTVLARTGAEARRALVWAAVAMVLGTLMVMGNRGLPEPATSAARFGPTSFPAANRRRRRPRSASGNTFDDAALDALREMDSD